MLLTFLSVCTVKLGGTKAKNRFRKSHSQSHTCSYSVPKHTSKKKKRFQKRIIWGPTFFRQWRNEYLKRSQATDLSGLSRGIFLGEDRYISQTDKELFGEAGLTHLLAASGFNCWIVAMLFSGVFQLLFVMIGSPLELCLGSVRLLRLRTYSSSVSWILGAWIFWFWSDQSPPITRSVSLITANFIFSIFRFSFPFPRVLLLQYCFFLIIWPKLWGNPSFQLTFGCLFGIIALPKVLKPFQPSHLALKKLWNYAAVSLGASLGTIPTTWIYFSEVNFNNLFTNWFSGAIVSALIMPIALAQMILVFPLWSDFSLGGVVFEVLGRVNQLAAELLLMSVRFTVALFPSLRYYD